MANYHILEGKFVGSTIENPVMDSTNLEYQILKDTDHAREYQDVNMSDKNEILQ